MRILYDDKKGSTFMLIALTSEQRTAVWALLAALAALAVGITGWVYQYRHPHQSTTPVASTEPEPEAPLVHTRRELLPEFDRHDMAKVASWLLALYGIGNIKLNGWSFDPDHKGYVGMQCRDYDGVKYGLAGLLGYKDISDVPKDQHSLTAFCNTLKNSEQFAELLLANAGPLNELWKDYCHCMNTDLQERFAESTPPAWLFDYLKVAAAARLPQDQLANGVKVSQLVLTANFMLALNGCGLLAVTADCREVTDTAEYKNVTDQLMDIIGLPLGFYQRSPQSLIWALMQVPPTVLLELFVTHINSVLSAREYYWEQCERPEFQPLIPFLPSRETLDVLKRIHDRRFTINS